MNLTGMSGSVADTKALMERMRADGMTMTEIAKTTGYSLSRVQQLLGKPNCRNFRYKTSKDVIYPGLREFINGHMWSVRRLVEALGYQYSSNTERMVLRSLRGDRQWKKDEIDCLLKVTGLTYEECFGEQK